MSDIPDNHELARRITALEERMAAASAPGSRRDWSTILAIVGTGIALAALIVPGQNEVRQNVTDLRERMAVVETLLTEHRSQHPPAE